MIVRKIRPEELKRTKELFSIAFEYAYDCEEDAMEVYRESLKNPKSREDVCLLEKYAAFLDDDKTMTSCLSAIRYPMQFDGHSVTMAGIGGVSSLPQYRRTGGIRGCFTKMLPELYADGVAFSCLYPFSTAYYRKFGYEVGGASKVYDLDLSYLPAYKVKGHCVLLDETNRESASEDVKKVYQVWQQHYNGMIENESFEFVFATEANPYKKQEFVYLYYGEDAVPKAYLVFHKEKDEKGQKLVCSKFVFADVEGFKGLLALAKTFASDHYCIRFGLPEDRNITPLLEERSFGACKITESTLGMVRVVNVERVLKMARYRGSGVISIQVKDPYIPENNGTFGVMFTNGKAAAVKRLEDKTPQIEMTIAEFSRWMMGTMETEALEFCEDVKIQDSSIVDTGLAGQVFYKKPCYLMEYF